MTSIYRLRQEAQIRAHRRHWANHPDKHIRDFFGTTGAAWDSLSAAEQQARIKAYYAVEAERAAKEAS